MYIHKHINTYIYIIYIHTHTGTKLYRFRVQTQILLFVLFGVEMRKTCHSLSEFSAILEQSSKTRKQRGSQFMFIVSVYVCI